MARHHHDKYGDPNYRAGNIYYVYDECDDDDCAAEHVHVFTDDELAAHDAATFNDGAASNVEHHYAAGYDAGVYDAALHGNGAAHHAADAAGPAMIDTGS